jgi:hypothetical protein
MITGIPNRKDFEEQGLTLLNLAWDTISDLLLQIADANERCGPITEDEKKRHLIAPQRKLAIATALLQQGAEFMVKAAIADYSPFLLISGTPSTWPRRSDKEDVEFPEFKTADATDLIKIHDTVATTRFSPEFSQMFSELRRVRNSIFHTVDKKLSFSSKHILESVLRISGETVGTRKWMDIRYEYLESIPSIGGFREDSLGRLSREFVEMTALLDARTLGEHFGFNKKQRQYICPRCTEANQVGYARTAQLDPNSPASNALYCPVCRSHQTVIRQRCKREDCKGNVLDADPYHERVCLTCYEDNFDL